MAWAKPAGKHQKKLKKMKASVESAYMYWRNNYRSYNEFRKFFYKTSMNDEDISLATELNRPTIQWNVGEVNYSRLMGEFAKQEPGIEVRPAYGAPVDPQTVVMVDGYMRHLLTDAHKNNFEYRVMEDVYSGGWSVGKVRTDYIHDMSFDQDIIFERVHEPTLCGFDPMARNPSKDDGDFCFENFPMTKELFKKKYKEVPLDNVQFISSNGGFTWSYKSENGETDVLIVCDYYLKKKKRFHIVELTPTDPSKPGQVMKKKDYIEAIKQWELEGKIEQPPAIVNERMTEQTIIMRYRFMEDTVLEVEEMDFKDFPLVFFDGNSKLIRDTENGNFEQLTRPYLYHFKDAQRFLNYALQSLANQLENIPQSRLLIAEESLPSNDDYMEAITNPQIPSNVVYKAFKDDSPETQIPPPIVMEPPHIPPEIVQSITLTLNVMQNILGSFDAAQGANSHRVSNDSLLTSITQSNAAAEPYIVGFLQGLDHMAKMALYLIPRYITNPRVLPVKDRKGVTNYATVNAPDTPSMQYEDNSLHITVKAGVNFAVQQQQAIQIMSEVSKQNQILQQFMSTKGLKFWFDNIDFRGKEELMQEVADFQKELEEQQEKQAQQSTPEQLKYQAEMAKTQAGIQESQNELKMHEDEIEQEKRDNQVELVKIQAELAKAHETLNSEAVHKHADRMITMHDQHHRHKKETLETHIKHIAANKPKPEVKK